MYGFVPYQLTGMQSGIQLSHAIQEYANEYIKYLKSDGSAVARDIWDKAYTQWSTKDKTIIGLNGGSTNLRYEDGAYIGSMNNYLAEIESHGIFVKAFYEEDLGDQLTGFCLLVDERVWDRKTYPKFEPIPRFPAGNIGVTIADIQQRDRAYQRWVDSVGGEANAWLRTFLPKFKTA